jgi:hypothetical protein
MQFNLFGNTGNISNNISYCQIFSSTCSKMAITVEISMIDILDKNAVLFLICCRRSVS